MSKPGRRKGTPKERRTAIMAATRKAREAKHLTHERIAALLSEEVGRPISADTYRKWEKTALLPLDVLIPFCEITGVDPWELLEGEPLNLSKLLSTRRRNAA